VEEWRDIEGFEGVYQASNLGKIKSLARIEKIGDSTRNRQETILKQRIGFDGHYFVELYKDNVVKRLFVHRLVFGAFRGKLITGQIVHHIDHDKLNNEYINLQQMTVSDHNTHHKLEVLEGQQGFRQKREKAREEFLKKRRQR
jgi:hypothetical protein